MRKQLLLGALTALGLAFTMQLSAQKNDYLKCGTADALKKMYAENPQMEADFYAFMEQNKEVRTVNGKKRDLYIIPIVFHIVHQYGTENITDAQVYSEMEILNNDFRKKNADTSAIITEFKPIAADAQIEFRLASIDPQGNCTNGIDHIYSHNSNLADDYSKLNQWHRSRYLNVWVVNTIGSSGVAGYAYYPTATTGNSFWIDGIIILNDYIGAVGTGSAFTSRALTHEIGHYLSLPHTWGSTNDPEVACGDDGVEDTPETAGHLSCQLSDADCNPGVIENVQNFMEYSYCSNMYTIDQSTQMQNTLASDVSGRNSLTFDTTHVLTGANYDGDPLARTPCIPQADFNPDNFMVCAGSTVTYKNFTWRGAATSYSWSFPGGTPSTSTSANPVVTYNEPGFYNATLTATNATGSTTLTKQNAVYISATWPEHTGPYSINFNSNNEFFITQDLGNDFSQWTRVNGAGPDGSACYKLNNYKDVSNAQAFSDDFFYYSRLGNAKDNMISPSYDLSTTSGVTVSFDYSYGSRTPDLDNISEKIVVYSSRDCGKTWTLRKTIQKAELLTSGYVGAVDYAPTNTNQWKTVTIPYTVSASLDKRTRFKIEYTSSDYSSNLYIDNFNVSGLLGIDDLAEMSEMSISPNPVSQGSDIAIQIGSMTEAMTLEVINMEGKVISTHVVNPVNAIQTINIPMNVAKGCYMINASQGNARSTNRVIVF